LVLNAVFALSVPVLGITGWWFARNQVLYGDPLGWSMYTKVFSINLRQNAFQWSDLGDMLIWQFRSFWGVFGWMNILLPNIYYTLYLALCAIALVSVMYFFARSFHHLSSFQAKSIAWFIVFIILQEAYLLTLNTRCNASCYQGRYLFPVISLSAVVIGWGISNLLPRRIANLLAVSLMLGLLMVAVFIPFGIIGPAY